MKAGFGFIPYIFAGAICGILISVILYAPPMQLSVFSQAFIPTPTPTATPTPTPSPTPTPTPQPLPTHITIPKIGVDAAVENVGLDVDNKMGIPTDWYKVGWYEYGPKPGEKGSSVMDGHLDTSAGTPAVFWNLAKLQPGDQIVITDEKGNQYTFVVKNMMQYDINNVPMQEIFQPTDKKLLNLITCSGWWNVRTHNYSHRTVVYTELAE